MCTVRRAPFGIQGTSTKLIWVAVRDPGVTAQRYLRYFLLIRNLQCMILTDPSDVVKTIIVAINMKFVAKPCGFKQMRDLLSCFTVFCLYRNENQQPRYAWYSKLLRSIATSDSFLLASTRF